LRDRAVLQRSEDALDAALGRVADGGVGGDDGQDHRGVDHRPAEQRQRGRAAQQHDGEGGEVVAHDGDRRFRAVRGQQIVAMGEAPPLHLGRRKSGVRRRPEPLDRRGHRGRVPSVRPCELVGAMTVAAGARSGRLPGDGGEQALHRDAARVEVHEHAAGERIDACRVDRAVAGEPRLERAGHRGRAAERGDAHARAARDGD
jgi:hypothetical protein